MDFLLSGFRFLDYPLFAVFAMMVGSLIRLAPDLSGLSLGEYPAAPGAVIGGPRAEYDTRRMRLTTTAHDGTILPTTHISVHPWRTCIAHARCSTVKKVIGTFAFI